MITEMNAYRFNDNFAIVKTSTGEVLGLEHNKTEADAVAKYLTNYHGQVFSVVRNSKDDVRQAKQIRKDVLRVRNRDSILRDLGVW